MADWLGHGPNAQCLLQGSLCSQLSIGHPGPGCWRGVYSSATWAGTLAGHPFPFFVLVSGKYGWSLCQGGCPPGNIAISPLVVSACPTRAAAITCTLPGVLLCLSLKRAGHMNTLKPPQARGRVTPGSRCLMGREAPVS